MREMCIGADGKLTKNALIILSYLRFECNGDGRYGPPVAAATGAIDPLAMARAAGRREIFDIIVRMLSVDLRERYNLEFEQ